MGCKDDSGEVVIVGLRSGWVTLPHHVIFISFISFQHFLYMLQRTEEYSLKSTITDKNIFTHETVLVQCNDPAKIQGNNPNDLYVNV